MINDEHIIFMYVNIHGRLCTSFEREEKQLEQSRATLMYGQKCCGVVAYVIWYFAVPVAVRTEVVIVAAVC